MGLVFCLHRFQCSLCSRNWASAQVQVLFHMHWSEGESRGQVKMRVFAQRCQKCSQPSFEVPEFTEENISRIRKRFRFYIATYARGLRPTESLSGFHGNRWLFLLGWDFWVRMRRR